MIHLPLVKDCMVSPVITIREDSCIYKAIDTLIENQISGAPVVNESGKLTGVISEKDCFKIISKGVNHMLPEEGETVEKFMTKDVKTITPDVNIFYAAGIFLKQSYRRLPVVEHDKVVGQISRVDVLKGIRKYISEKYPLVKK